MKLQIFLAFIAVTCMVTYVHGSCSMGELTKCMKMEPNCESLIASIDCYKRCGVDIPSQVNDALKEAGCGASALTNIGLPMMLLVVLAVFYNK